jgi:energy-coupling factor transporter ATP-binding protein EcfA2
MDEPDYRAKTLEEAYQICDVAPLDKEQIVRYYVDLSLVRQTEAIESVNTLLKFHSGNKLETILFTGHRGCGKSTELKRIQDRWHQDYLVVYLETDAETDINDVNYTDLYLIVIKHVEYKLRQIGKQFDPILLESFEQWFKDVTRETEATVAKSIGIESDASLSVNAPFLAKLLVKLTAQIRGSQTQKKVIRETLQRDISRLSSDVNLLLRDAFEKIKDQYPKGFLIIFDNLDRVSPEVGQHLFFDYAAQLQEFACTVIYTVPISVLCAEKNLSTSFGDPHVMPAINIYNLDRQNCHLEHNQAALNTIAQIIRSRVDAEKLFDSEEQLFDLVKASGGHARQLMQLMRTACLTAATRNHESIQAEDTLYAINQQQFGFERFIPNHHYPLLAEVCLSKNITKDQIGQLMLFNLSVLEYNGTNRWNYPNPVVKRSEYFQKALQNALDQQAIPTSSEDLT